MPALRLPSLVISFRRSLALPDERLTIRHVSGSGRSHYVAGILLARQEVMRIRGLVRGFDQLLFSK